MATGLFKKILGLSLLSAVSALGAETYNHGENQTAGFHAVTSIVRDQTLHKTYSYDRNGNPYAMREGNVDSLFEYTSTLHLKKVTKGSNNNSQRSLYDAEENKLASIQDSGAKVYAYVGSVRMLTSNGVLTPKALINYGDAELNEDQEVQFFLQDHLGSPVAVADRFGIKEAKDSLPYGNAWYLRTSAGGQDFTDYDFTGQRKEGDLLDYKARYRFPGENFLQADTMIDGPGTPTGYNHYAYVHNNPVNATDPSGNAKTPIVGMWEGYPAFSKENMQNVDEFVAYFRERELLVPNYDAAVYGQSGAILTSNEYVTMIAKGEYPLRNSHDFFHLYGVAERNISSSGIHQELASTTISLRESGVPVDIGRIGPELDAAITPTAYPFGRPIKGAQQASDILIESINVSTTDGTKYLYADGSTSFGDDSGRARSIITRAITILGESTEFRRSASNTLKIISRVGGGVLGVAGPLLVGVGLVTAPKETIAAQLDPLNFHALSTRAQAKQLYPKHNWSDYWHRVEYMYSH